ncbi:hypothetical protein ACFXOD_33715 [Streptomyces sp. NPDC059161]|uniref:hypothetical protein n=1 Tax=Streptomyces sp. NPDC059161 TaxID=3346749 RepID=UPI0036AAFB05
MGDFEYVSLYCMHLAGHLRQESRDWPEPVWVAVNLLQTVGVKLRRDRFEEFVDCVREAVRLRRRRAPELLPDTFLTHLHGPLKVRFGAPLDREVAMAALLFGAVHESLPVEEFAALMDGLMQTRQTMAEMERRLGGRGRGARPDPVDPHIDVAWLLPRPWGGGSPRTPQGRRAPSQCSDCPFWLLHRARRTAGWCQKSQSRCPSSRTTGR